MCGAAPRLACAARVAAAIAAATFHTRCRIEELNPASQQTVLDRADVNPLRLEWLAGFTKHHPDESENNNMRVRFDKLPGFEHRGLPVRGERFEELGQPPINVWPSEALQPEIIG